MKIERTRIHFSATFSLPSPSSGLKVPIGGLFTGKYNFGVVSGWGICTLS